MISIQYSDWSILKILIGQWLTSIWDFFLTFSTSARNSPRVVCSSSAPTGPLIADRVLLLNNQYNMIGQYNMISQCIMIGYLLVLLLTLGLLSALFLLTSLLVLSQCSEMIKWMIGSHLLICLLSPPVSWSPPAPLLLQPGMLFSAHSSTGWAILATVMNCLRLVMVSSFSSSFNESLPLSTLSGEPGQINIYCLRLVQQFNTVWWLLKYMITVSWLVK